MKQVALAAFALAFGLAIPATTACAQEATTGTASQAAASSQTSATATAKPDYQKLVGRWIRPDGGYVVDIRSVAPDGKMDAKYYNPSSINVGKAQASSDGKAMKVYVELRDTNYPGSNYTLQYDAGKDLLSGVYFQAVEKQQFEIFFERAK